MSERKTAEDDCSLDAGPHGLTAASITDLLLVGWLKCCFTSIETVGLLGTGAQDVHLDFHTAPELCDTLRFGSVVLLNVLGCRLTY